jgi:ankyrin repeat protein
LAAGYGHQAIVDLLLDRGAPCPLFNALSLAQPALVAAALEADPAAARTPNRYGRTPVQMAADAAMWAHTFANLDGYEKHKESLALLLARGAPAEIWSAIVLDQPEMAEQLLDERPALLNLPDNGNTPLHCAAVLGRTRIAERLIRRGAALEARDFAGATPLRRGAGFIPGVGHGHADTAALLLRHGANLDARNNWNDTPVAVGLATPAVAEVMLAHGAPLTIHAAAALGRGEAVAALLEEDSQRLNAPGPFGFTPLNWAVANGHTALAADLLDRGAPLTTNTWDRSLLTWANLCEQPAVANLLRSRGLTE